MDSLYAMHVLRVAPALLLLAIPRPLASQAEQAGGFVTRRAGQVVARERYRFDGRSLRAEVELLGQGYLVEAETAFEDRGVPGWYRTRVRAAQGGAVMTEVQATFADSVRWSVLSGGGLQDGVSPVRRPLFVAQNSIFSQLALALQMHGRSLGRRPLLYAWRPEGGAVSSVGVSLSGQEGTVQLGGIRMEVELDASGWIRRLEVPAQNIVVEWQAEIPLAAGRVDDPADSLPPAGVREEPVRFSGGGATLSGTLVVPTAPGPVPVAVIVASGAADRNGNTLPSVRPNTYAQLAWGLAGRGIAALRFDQRAGLGLTTFDDLAEDVVGAVRALSTDPRFSRVVVLGHQEGGWLAIRAAVRGTPAAGIALLGTPARPFVEVLRHRLARTADSLRLVQFDSALARFLRGEPQAGLPLYLDLLLQPANRRYLESLAAYAALSELRRVEVPVLIVQGDRDTEVPPGDAEVLRAAAARGEVVILPGANHLFKEAELANRIGELALDMDPRVAIVNELVERMAAWVSGFAR